MNLLLRSILATAMLIPFDAVVEEAEAAGAGTCKQYVAAARSLAARAKAAKCDFWGGGFNEASSRRWCNGVKEQTISDSMRTDAAKVKTCESCRGYANKANEQIREAMAFRCGFSGGQWGLQDGGPNDGHFQWCKAEVREDAVDPLVPIMSALDISATREMLAQEYQRDQALKQCKSQWRTKFTAFEIVSCEDYAKAAVDAAKTNARNKCGAISAGRWGIDRDPHLFWCLPRVDNPESKAEVDRETKIRETGASACEAGGKLKPDGDVLWKGPPIRTLGKRKPQAPGLRPDQIDAKPAERKPLGTGRPIGAVVKHPGSGGISTSTCSDAVNRLGGGGCGGTVPNLVPQPKGGGSGGSYLSSGGNKPGAGGTTPAATAPANDSPIKRLGKSGPDSNIDFGGRPTPSTGTKIR